MAKRQTRRSVSLSGKVYQRLHDYCVERGQAKSELVELLVMEHIESRARAGTIAVAPRPQAERAPALMQAESAGVHVGQRWKPRDSGRRADVRVVSVHRWPLVGVRLCTASEAFSTYRVDCLRQWYRPVDAPIAIAAKPAAKPASAPGRSLTLPSGVVVRWPAATPPGPPAGTPDPPPPALTPHVLVAAPPMQPQAPDPVPPPLVATAPPAPVEAVRPARADVTERPRFDPRTMDQPRDARPICTPRQGGPLVF